MLSTRAKKWIASGLTVVLLLILVALAVPSVLRSIETVKRDLAEEEETETVSGTESGGNEDAGFANGPFERIAETNRLELYFREQDSAIQIKDKTNGYVWRSSVPLDEIETSGNELWTASSQSIFHMTYTDPNLPALEIKETNSALLKPVISTSPAENGVRVHYELTPLHISFDMIFQLKDDALEVTVLADSIQESDQYWLMTLAPLPFLGAASDQDDGYVFYPDGPGAISYFKENHPQYLQPYKSSVYGPDTLDFTLFRSREKNAMLPVFGMKKGDNAFAGIITDGEFDANIVFSPSGYLINLNRVSAELIYRRTYEAARRNGNLTKQAEREMIRRDHTIRYVFLNGEDSDYSGMANAYRDYLLNEKGVQRRIQPGDPIPYGIDLLMGIEENRILFDRFIPATTFSQAREIFEDLRSRGVEKISANLLGWAGRGFMLYPSGGDPSDALGGKSGLRQLTQYAKEQGIQLFLQDNFVDAYSEASGFSERNDVVRGANGFVVSNRYGNSFYLNAQIQNRKFQNSYVKRLGGLEISGINFDRIGSLNYYDFNDNAPLTREGTAQQWLEMMEKSRDQFGGAAAVGGNGYVLPYADRVFDIPMEDSGYFFTDEVVPFYQIVLHGIIPYSGHPQNLFYDPEMQFLKMIEYGYMPFYQLTYNYSDDLGETDYSELFSSAYTSWVDISVSQYLEMNDKLRHIWPQTIRKHRQVMSDVFEVVYEQGDRILINYRPADVTVDGLTVPERSYIVVPGEG
jgi:hypothetical protein